MATLFYSSPRARFFDSNGNPLSEGRVSYYFPGTTTLKEIYTDNTEATPAQNPQPLDAEGYVRDGGVWLGEGLYDVLLEASDGAGGFVTEWTMPNVGNPDSVPSGSIGNVAYVETINDLINLDTSLYGAVYVFGYYSVGDGGHGWFYLDAASTLAPDGGAVVAPLGTPATGRWIRIFSDDKLSCTKWGATESAPGSVNSNLTNWANYANDLNKGATMHIPPGMYTVVPGSLTVSQYIVIDNGVTFNVNGPGAFNFAINARFEINTFAKITDVTSQGSCNLDFTANTNGYIDLEVRPEWYETEALTFDLCGDLFVLITQPTTVSLAGPKTGSLRFSDSGSIDVSGDTLTVPKLDVGNITTQRFTHGLALPEPPLAFSAGTSLYTESFASLLQMAECDLTGTAIRVNGATTVINGQIIDVSAASSIVNDGFFVEVATGGTLTAPGILGNQSVKSAAGLITTASGIYDRYAFVIDSQLAFDGFFVCAYQNAAIVDFKDYSTTYDLDLTGAPVSTIIGLSTSGGFTCSSIANLKRCTFSGLNTVATADLFVNDCLLVSNLTCNAIEIVNSRVQGILTAASMEAKNNVITGELIPTAGAGQYDFDIRNNQFLGGYVRPNGSALSTKAYIIENDFQFPSGEDPGTFLYTPIDGTNFAVTGESFIDNAVTFNVAYNVKVAENTPMWRDFFNPPTVGTKLLQTVVEGNELLIGAATRNTFIVNTDRMLLPYIANDMYYNHFMVDFLANPGALSIVRSALRPANVIDANAIELNAIFETSAGSSLASEWGGFSFKLDLYPQRGI